jgi:hypothetical protein
MNDGHPASSLQRRALFAHEAPATRHDRGMDPILAIYVLCAGAVLLMAVAWA